MGFAFDCSTGSAGSTNIRPWRRPGRTTNGPIAPCAPACGSFTTHGGGRSPRATHGPRTCRLSTAATPVVRERSTVRGSAAAISFIVCACGRDLVRAPWLLLRGIVTRQSELVWMGRGEVTGLLPGHRGRTAQSRRTERSTTGRTSRNARRSASSQGLFRSLRCIHTRPALRRRCVNDLLLLILLDRAFHRTVYIACSDFIATIGPLLGMLLNSS